MASSSNFALLLLAFSLLAVSAAARPCKTLFFITTSTSYYRQFPISQNPNFFLHNPNSISPRFRTFFFSTSGHPTRFGSGFVTPLSRPSIFFRRSDPFFIRRPDPIEEQVEELEEKERSSMMMMMPVELYSSVTSSIRDRTKDIMRVVGALLFGVGCGALTAATMYLIWSLFWPNRFDFDESDDVEYSDDGFDDVSAAKKLGYVAIPNKVVDDDLKKPAPPAPAPAPAKEVV